SLSIAWKNSPRCRSYSLAPWRGQCQNVYASMPPSVPQRGCVELPQARVRVPAVDHQLLAVLLRRIEHHVGEQLLHDAAQRARAELLLHRVLDDGPKRPFLELQLHAVDLQRLPV